MTNDEKISQYIGKHSFWSNELMTLRELFGMTELQEEVKWGCPCYTLNGKIVAGFGAFKNHCAIWFHQGVFLTDSHKKLLNAQEGKTKALRQWRFVKGDSIPSELVLKYIQEAIQNAMEGKEMKPNRNQVVSLPPLLKEALEDNVQLKEAFLGLTPGRQREYAEHIGSAKQEATQKKRLQLALPGILNRRGLNDKYKNS